MSEMSEADEFHKSLSLEEQESFNRPKRVVYIEEEESTFKKEIKVGCRVKLDPQTYWGPMFQLKKIFNIEGEGPIPNSWWISEGFGAGSTLAFSVHLIPVKKPSLIERFKVFLQRFFRRDH